MAFSPKCWASLALALAFCGWVVYLAGVGSLHHACRRGGSGTNAACPHCPPAAAHPPARLRLPAELTGAGERQQLFSSAGLVYHSSCAFSNGWFWWTCFFELGAVALVGLLAGGARRGLCLPLQAASHAAGGD